MTHSTYQMQTSHLTRAFMLENKYLGRLQDMSFYYICKAWEDINNCRCEENVSGYIHALFCNTVRLTLSKHWSDIKLCDREKLRGILASVNSQACRTLAGLLPNPWGHDTVVKVLQNTAVSNEIIGSDVDEEWYLKNSFHICTTNCYSEPRSVPQARVELLCHAGYKNEALRLCLFYHHCPILSQDHVFSETALHLLYNMGKIKHMIDVIQTLTCHDGFQLVQHILNNGSSAVHPLVECLIQILLVRDLVGPSPYCCTLSLMKTWCWLHFKQKTNLETVILEAKKLGALSSTSAHLYLLVDVLYEQYGRALLPLYLTLYVHALTIDINNLEYARQVDCRVAIAELETHMAGIYIKLASLLNAEGKVGLARECVLTAFSLEPTIDRLNQLQRYSAFQTPMWRFHNFLPLDPCVGECHCIEKGLCRREPQVPSWFLTHVPNGILDSSLQGVSQQLLHDLCILVEGPRCRWLSWNIPWDSLCNICLSYLHSAREIRAESDDRGVGIDARLKRLGPFERISLTSFEVKSHSNKPLESDIHFVSVVDGDDDNPVFENSKDEFKNCVMDIIMTENVVSAEPSNGNLLENVPGLEHDLGKGSCASVKETEVILLDEDENPPVVRMNVETRTLKSDNDIELVLNMGKPDSLMTTSSLTKGEDVVDSVKETGDVAKVPALFSDENAIKQFTCEVQMDSSTSSLSKDEKETGLLTHSNCVIEDDGKTSTLARDKTDVLKNNSEVEKATNVPTLMPSCVKTTTSPNVLRTCRIVLEDISHKLPHFGNLISTTIGNSSKSTKVTNAGHASNTNLTGPQKSSCHQSSSHAPQAESTKKEHGDNDKKCHVTTSLTSSLADASRLGHLTILPSISGKPLIPFVVIDKLQDRHILSLANPSVSEEQNSSRIRTGDCSEITPEKLELKIESPISSSELSDGCLHECVSAVNTDSRKSNPAEHKKMSSLEKCKPLILSATKREHSIGMLTPNTTPVLGIQTCDPVVREGERKTPGTLTSRKSHRQSTEADNHTTHATSNTSASSSLNVMDTPERQCSPVKCSEITSTSHLGVENSDDVLPLEDKIVFHNKMSCDSAAGKSHEEQIIAIIDSEITSLEINTAYDNQSDYPMKLSPPSKLNGTSPSSNGKTYVETSSGLSTTLTRPLTNSGDSIVHLKHNRISPCMEKPSVKSMSTKEVSATKVMPINKQLASSTAFENLVAETLEVRDKKKLFPIKEGKPVALTLESLVAETLDIPTEALISIKPSCVNSEDNSEIGTVDDTLVSAGVVEYPVVGNSPTSVVLESTDACQIAMSTYGGTCDFVTLPINVGDSLTDFTTKSIMTSSYSKVPNQNPSVSYVAASTSGGAAVFPVVSTAQELAITPGGVSVTFITTPEPHSAVLDHMYSDPKHIVTLKALSPTTPLTSVPSKIDSTPLSHPSPHVTWTSVPSKVETSSLLARQSTTLPRPNVVPQHPVLVTLPPGEKTEVSMVTSSGTNAVITPSNMIHAIPLTSSTVSHEDLQHIKPSLGNIVIQQNNQPQSHMEVSQVHNGHSVNMGVTHIQIDPLGNMQIVHPSLAVEPSPKSQVKIPTSSPVQVTHAIHLPLQSQPQTGRLPVCASLPPRLSEKKAFGSTQNAITMKPSRPLLQSVVQPKVVFKTPRAPESQVGQHTDTVCATQPSLKYFVKPVSNISSSPQQVLSMHDSTFGMLKYAQKIPAAVVSDISPVITLINQPVAEFIQTSAARSSNVHSFAVSSTSSLTSTHSVTSPSISTAYTSGNIQSSTMLSRVKQVPLKISAPSVMMAQSVAGQQSKSLMTPVDQCLTTQQNGHKGKPIQSTDGVKTVGSLCQKPSSIHRQTSVRLNTTNQDSVKNAVQMTNSILAEALLRSGSSKPPQACTSLTDANISPVVLPSSESANGLSSTGQLEFKTHVLIPESRTQIGNNRKVVFTHKKDRKWVSVRSAHGVMGYRKADNEDPKSNSTVFTDSSQSSVPCSSVSSPPTIVVAKTVIPSLLNNSTTTNSFASLPGVTAVSHNMVVSSPAKGSLQTLPLVKKCQSPVTQSLNINRLHDTPKFTIFREAGQKSVIQARFSEDQQSPKQLPAAVNLTTVVSTPESKCIENKKVIQSIPKTASQPAICTAPATNASHNFRQLLEPKVVSTPKLFMLKSVSQPTQELPDVQSKLSLLQSSASSNSGNIASVNGLMAVNLKPSLHGLDVSASIGAHTLPPRNDPSSAYHKPDSATLDTSGVIADPITSSESLLSKSLCPMQQLSAPRTSSINDVQEESQSKFLSLPQTCVSTDSQPPRIRGILPSQSQLNSDLATYVSLSKNTSITTSLDESSSFLMTVPSVSLEPTDNDSSSTVVQDTDRKKDCGTTTKTSRKTVKKECPHCHKVLSSASGLRRHLLTIHDIAIPSGLLDRYIQRPTPALFAVSSKDKQVKKNLLKAKKESKCSSLNEPSKEFHAVDSECEPKMPDIDLMENKCDLALRSSENSSEATRSSTSGSSDHQRLTNIKLERRDPESFLSVSETLDSVNSTSENEFVCIHDSGDDTAMPLLMPEVPFPETLHQDADPSAVPTRGRVSSRSMKLAQKRSCPCCENTSPNSAKKCRGNKVKRGNVAGRKGVTLKSPRKT